MALNHPSLQPSLGRLNIKQLLTELGGEPALAASRDAAEYIGEPWAQSPEFRRGYLEGVQYAADKVTLMWHSAQIATEATRKHLEDDLTELSSPKQFEQTETPPKRPLSDLAAEILATVEALEGTDADKRTIAMSDLERLAAELDKRLEDEVSGDE